MKYLTCKNISFALAIWISFVFLQSGFFKFTGAPETVHIFSTVGAWMTANIHPFIGGMMTQYGGFIIGGAEYIASALLLIPVANAIFKKHCKCDSLLTLLGALMALGIMSGAIFFHLFTPLGINVQPYGSDVAGDGGTLFFMAVSVWISSLILIHKNRTAVCKC